MKGYEFDSETIFDNYITNFYTLKANALTPSDRYISKLHLNTLYGIFGRRKDLIKTVIIDNKDLQKYLSFSYIKSIITVNSSKSVLLINNNLNLDIIEELNNTIEGGVYPQQLQVKSNVAIAAAVTAYARIHMIPYKLDTRCCYTDTDSAFFEGEIDSKAIGKGIGLMKDELGGLVIEEAYFLGIKKYGYWYYDKTGVRVEKSVIAGVKRDGVSFADIKGLFNGIVLTKTIPIRFTKHLSTLDITISSTTVSVTFKPQKRLIGNEYIPLEINTLNDNGLLNILKSMIHKIYKIKKNV